MNELAIRRLHALAWPHEGAPATVVALRAAWELPSCIPLLANSIVWERLDPESEDAILHAVRVTCSKRITESILGLLAEGAPMQPWANGLGSFLPLLEQSQMKAFGETLAVVVTADGGQSVKTLRAETEALAARARERGVNAGLISRVEVGAQHAVEIIAQGMLGTMGEDGIKLDQMPVDLVTALGSIMGAVRMLDFAASDEAKPVKRETERFLHHYAIRELGRAAIAIAELKNTATVREDF